MHISRIYRLLRLITMLQSGRSYTVAQLAAELEVSRRTIFRDLNVLEMARVPYYYDRQRGTYRINQHFFLPPLNLTLSEALALLVAARRTAGSSVLPMARASEQASVKLESVLPQPVRDHLGTVLTKVAVRPAPPARHHGLDEEFDRLLAATIERKLCRLVYLSFQERKQITVTVEPLRLVFIGRAWYLIAYDRRHRQQRTYKLGRIRKLVVTDKTFPPREVTDDGLFGDAWCMIPEGRLYDVHLHFEPKVAGNVAEVNWHRTQRVEWNPDGSIEFHARVDGLGEITWWILGYGDQVKVIGPPELARRVAGVARSVAALYEGKEG